METEIWKDVVGYEGIYQVSSLGRIKSLSRYVNRNDGHRRLTPEKILISAKNYKGYMGIALIKDGQKYRTTVHRIMAKAFIPNPENKCDVNHINGIKDDNRIENLEWSTRTENVIHAYKLGLRPHVAPNAKRLKIIDTSTGIVYEKLNDAAKALGIHKNTLWNRLKNNKINTTPHIKLFTNEGF